MKHFLDFNLKLVEIRESGGGGGGGERKEVGLSNVCKISNLTGHFPELIYRHENYVL